MLFFTGLSGSGKSTLARSLVDLLLEQGERTVTSLDGDVVRRNLSAGLTFSREDRETNIRRIGWVAAEISRHGGVAVVSPIAPFDETRQQVRAMVDEAGGAFFLVHVATPLEECERRDRKGLYAGPGPARSPSSPASPRRTRSRRTPTSGSTPPGAPSRTHCGTSWWGSATPGTSTCSPTPAPLTLRSRRSPRSRAPTPRAGPAR